MSLPNISKKGINRSSSFKDPLVAQALKEEEKKEIESDTTQEEKDGGNTIPEEDGGDVGDDFGGLIEDGGDVISLFYYK